MDSAATNIVCSSYHISNIACHTLDLAEDLFLREEEEEDLPRNDDDFSAVISPSESDGKSFSSSSELSVVA